MKSKNLVPAAAFFGLSAVALGAFGAHALKSILVENGTVETWKTASMYHLIHAVVLLWLAGRVSTPRWVFGFFAGGITLFSGSLYLLAVTGVKGWGAITPIGGILLLVGWFGIALTARDSSA